MFVKSVCILVNEQQLEHVFEENSDLGCVRLSMKIKFIKKVCDLLVQLCSVVWISGRFGFLGKWLRLGRFEPSGIF